VTQEQESLKIGDRVPKARPPKLVVLPSRNADDKAKSPRGVFMSKGRK